MFNRYAIWFGLAWALVVVSVFPDPYWFMIIAVGAGMNGFVVAANDWKMPVRGLRADGYRHCAMDSYTRHNWMGDWIPILIGKASIGDFLIISGLLFAYQDDVFMDAMYSNEVIVIAFMCWFVGWLGGFNMREKGLQQARQELSKNFVLILLLMAVGRVFGMHGCSLQAMQARTHKTAEHVADAIAQHRSKPKVEETKWRSLGKISPPPMEVLARLKAESAKRAHELQEQQKQQIIAEVASPQYWAIISMSGRIMPRSRVGPFCHVTCTGHHGQTWDRETLPSFCNANFIPPETVEMPGWLARDDKTEYTAAWPGPATPGFENYKLYWK